MRIDKSTQDVPNVSGYLAASSGNVTDEVIAQYIEQQAIEERALDDDFTIDT